MTAPHTCHAQGCSTTVPRKLFMCRKHWYQLPKDLRDAVWATYRPGQEQTGRPSPAYLKAARSAIDWLIAKENGTQGTLKGI